MNQVDWSWFLSLTISAILSSPWVLGTPGLGASPSDLTPKRANLLGPL
ncbi:hypothetical protein FEAC_06580 [Ferrimicrobium acidiphilum DSM 19497]|uniref:Uncharacterized protein n=1 Tax=Ferrimicrobium acidiphilum DSM 19497 TaxID=1121877 RepID=A0A0D8FX43_9ACTN|nr:hypothetical protein FEAC_06580 [Ferrimicrobium acidiphilum DSM 19497]